MSGDAVALPDESPLWDAHDHPDRPLDPGAMLCSCVTCEGVILAQAERTPGVGIALATRCDRIVAAAEYLAEVMSADRTLRPLLYVRDDYVRRMYLPVDGWWFVPPRRWWSEACHEDEAAAGRRHPRHRVAKRQSDANRRPWHVTAATASAWAASTPPDADEPPLRCECYLPCCGASHGELVDLAAAGARLLRHARPLAD
jgi:hypothetical protein